MRVLGAGDSGRAGADLVMLLRAAECQVGGQNVAPDGDGGIGIEGLNP